MRFVFAGASALSGMETHGAIAAIEGRWKWFLSLVPKILMRLKAFRLKDRGVLLTQLT